MVDKYIKACGRSHGTKQWENLLTYARQSPSTSERVCRMIQDFRLTQSNLVDKGHESVHFALALFTLIVIMEDRERRQVEDYKNMLRVAEEENKDLISQLESKESLSEVLFDEVKKLQRKVDRMSDYEETKEKCDLLKSELSRVQDENARLKQCCEENEMLKAQCAALRLQKIQTQERLDEQQFENDQLKERLTSSNESLEICNREMEEISAENASLKEALHLAAEERLTERLSLDVPSSPSNSRSRCSSIDQVQFNASGVSFEIELENDQLKTELELKTAEISEQQRVANEYLLENRNLRDNLEIARSEVDQWKLSATSSRRNIAALENRIASMNSEAHLSKISPPPDPKYLLLLAKIEDQRTKIDALTNALSKAKSRENEIAEREKLLLGVKDSSRSEVASELEVLVLRFCDGWHSISSLSELSKD